MVYQSFSKRQMLAMTWWNRPGLQDYEGIICDGAIRSGKTISMVTGFFLWSMANFHRGSFALCGRTVGALRRNIISNLQGWLGDAVDIRESRSENKLTVSDKKGRCNTYYLFGGQDESSYKLIQGITLAGVLLDEAALMPRSFVEQACARCSVTGSKLWFNCNPEGPEHWLYKEWIQKSEEKHLLRLHFTMGDNPSLDPAIRQRYEAMYTGEYQQKAMEFLAEFLKGGRQDTDKPSPKLLDWEQDAGVIVAEVNKVAGQEIRALPYVHWWTFLSWFHGIEEGQLSMLVGIREKLRKGKKLEPHEKDYYREHKAQVDLKTRYSREELAQKQALEKLLGQQGG